MEKNESWDDIVKTRQREIAEIIPQGLKKIFLWMKDYFLGVGRWDDERLWREKFIVEMNVIDSIVRFSGLAEHCKDWDHAFSLYEFMRKELEKLKAKFFTDVSSNYGKEVFYQLLVDYFLYEFIDGEIQVRRKNRKIGYKFMGIIQNVRSQERIDDLLDQTRIQINFAKKRVPLHPKMTEVLKALNRRYKRYLDIQDAEDYRNDAILVYQKKWKTIIDKLKYDEFEPYTKIYSTLKDRYPLNNPTWDEFAPKYLSCWINLFRPLFPMLCGETENIPLKIRDQFKTRFRRLPKEELKSLDEEIEADDGPSGFRQIDLVTQSKDPEGELDSFLVDEVLRDLLYQDSFRDGIDRIIAKNLGPSDQKIANIIFKITGKSITKQTVRKHRIQHVEPIIRRLLEIRRIMMEDQNRDEKM